MINRAHRFHGRGSLRFVYQRGQTVRGQHFALKYTPSKRRNYRLAVVVSRKVHKSAVVRNRIRRRLYELVREIGNLSSFDMIFIVYSDEVAHLNTEELKKMVAAQLKRAGVISLPR